MTITIQYKIYPDSQSEPQKVAVQRDLVDIISEAPNAQDPTGGAGGGQTPASVASESNATTPVIQASSAMGGQPQTVIAKSTAKVVKFAGGTAMNHIVLAFLFKKKEKIHPNYRFKRMATFLKLLTARMKNGT